MSDTKAQWDEIFSAHNERSEKYMKLLPPSGDVSLIVLKGHLIIEEMLFEIAATHCCDRGALQKAKLSFAQLLCVTQALIKLPLGDCVWPAVSALNSIRNALVHNLNPRDLEKRIKSLEELCKGDRSILPPDYVPPTEIAKIAASCIAFIMGALSVVGPVSEMLAKGILGNTAK